jgi:hypothetical protein
VAEGEDTQSGHKHNNPEPNYVGFWTTRRHILASKPELTDDDVLHEIRDATYNLKLFYNPPPELHRQCHLEREDDGGFQVIIPVKYFKICIEQSSYREDQVLALWPPVKKKNDRKGIGGRPPSYLWDELAICFGAMLQDERNLGKPEDVLGHIQEIARKLGWESIPDRQTIQPYRDRWQRTFAAWKRKEDAGN